MTLNANRAGRDQQAATRAEQRRLYQRREKRRWNLLASRHKLPARGWEAAREYILWLDDEWLEVIDVHGAPEVKPTRDPRFTAFALGGAAAFLRGYDLPPQAVVEFMAGSLYVRNRKLPTDEIRRVRDEAQEVCTQLAGYLGTLYQMGMERGEWRLECRREREGCEAPPLVETTGDEPEPAGLLDLLDLDVALEQRAIH